MTIRDFVTRIMPQGPTSGGDVWFRQGTFTNIGIRVKRRRAGRVLLLKTPLGPPAQANKLAGDENPRLPQWGGPRLFLIIRHFACLAKSGRSIGQCPPGRGAAFRPGSQRAGTTSRKKTSTRKFARNRPIGAVKIRRMLTPRRFISTKGRRKPCGGTCAGWISATLRLTVMGQPRMVSTTLRGCKKSRLDSGDLQDPAGKTLELVPDFSGNSVRPVTSRQPKLCQGSHHRARACHNATVSRGARGIGVVRFLDGGKKTRIFLGDNFREHGPRW